MKKLTLSLILMTFSAQAEEVKWVKGPFWSAPQVREMSLSLKSLDKELAESCNSYKKLVAVYNKDEPSDYLAKKFEASRKMILPSSMNSSFQTFFEIKRPSAHPYLIEAEVDLSTQNINYNLNILPMYNQEKATTAVALNDIEQLKANISSSSLMAFSRSLGLEDSKASLIYKRGQAIILIEGRDLACDLLAKEASLVSYLPSTVSLTEEAAKEIVNFYYFKVSPTIESAISKSTDSLITKSAKLGFRLGKVLEEKAERIDNEVLEKQLVNMLGLLFVPKTLTPSSKFTLVDKKRVVDVTSQIEGEAVKLSLEVQ